MRDMTRDELQDLLPELLHGRLSATDAAELERAVAADPDLSAEMDFLRSVRRVQQPARAIDVARIVAALPSPPFAQLPPVIDELAQRREANRREIIGRFASRRCASSSITGGA